MEVMHPMSIGQHMGSPGSAFEEQGNFMDKWLGPLDYQQKIGLYENVRRDHDHVSHLGIKRFLGHRVLTQMLNTDISIAMLLPPQQVTPGLEVFEWSLEEAMPGIAPPVSEEAPFPQLQYSTETRRARIERRGLMTRMTANILNTAEGIARVRSQLIMMMATMLRTFEFETLQALLGCHKGPLYKQKINMNKFDSERDFERICSWEASRAGSWNKNIKEEIAKDMAEAEKCLGKYQPPPYVVLVPAGQMMNLQGTTYEGPGERLYIQTMDSSKMNIEFESLPSTLRLGNGSLAFPVPDFQIGREPTYIQPLTRHVLWTEHFEFDEGPPDTLAYRTGAQLPSGGFSSALRDRWLYDAKTDTNQLVKFRDLLENSGFLPHVGEEAQDPINHYLGRNSPLSAGDFESPNRQAPSRVYYEGLPKLVKVFGQFDDNIVSFETHRKVGCTIAQILYGHDEDGTDILKHINRGTKLIRELATAPFNKGVADALVAAMGNNTVSYDQAAADLVAIHPGIGNVDAIPQNWNGTPVIASTDLGNLVTAFGQVAVPPFMASLAGIELLSQMRTTPQVMQGAAPSLMGITERAHNLLEAARIIYSILKDKFPNALALNPEHRPVNYLAKNGFATFFSNVFLNNANPPILIGAAGVVTPFNWTQATLEGVAGNLDPFTVGTAGAPLHPIGSPQPVAIGSRGFEKTTWVAQHKRMFDHQKSQGRGYGRSMGGRGGRPRFGRSGGSGSRGVSGAGAAAVVDEDTGQVVVEEDLFGAHPSLRRQRGRGRSAPIGAPFGGAPGEEGALVPGEEPRGMRSGLGNAAENPVYSENMKRNWERADRMDDALLRICILVYLTARCGVMEDLLRMVDSNILVPFNIFALRPAMEFGMNSVIVFKPGLVTGMQAISDAVLDAGKNVPYQTRMLTYSLRFKTLVLVEDHVVILPNRLYESYRSGASVKIYKSPREYQDYTRRPDIIAMVIPLGHRIERVEPMGGINVRGMHNDPKGSYRWPDAGINEEIWGLSRQSERAQGEANSFVGDGRSIPLVSWRGESLNWNMQIRSRCQGHRADASHPGCRAVYDGERALMPPYTSEAAVM